MGQSNCYEIMWMYQFVSENIYNLSIENFQLTEVVFYCMVML